TAVRRLGHRPSLRRADASRSPLSAGSGQGSGPVPYARRGKRLGRALWRPQRQLQARALDPRACTGAQEAPSADKGDESAPSRGRLGQDERTVMVQTINVEAENGRLATRSL